jgi:hypothetical protein
MHLRYRPNFALQPVWTACNLWKRFTSKKCSFAGILKALEIPGQVSYVSDKEEIPGSSIGRPTLRNSSCRQIAGSKAD